MTFHWRIWGGCQTYGPQRDPILLFSHAFSPKSACIRGPCPPPNGSTHPLREILDPPLHLVEVDWECVQWCWTFLATLFFAWVYSVNARCAFWRQPVWLAHCDFMKSWSFTDKRSAPMIKDIKVSFFSLVFGRKILCDAKSKPVSRKFFS